MGYDYIKQLVKREATSVIVPEGEVKKITVQYAGVVYFKNQEDAIKAVKILGESVKDLF